MCDSRQADGERRAVEILECQRQTFAVERARVLNRLLGRRPHEIDHVASARHAQLGVRQTAHVVEQVRAQWEDQLAQ